MPTLRKRGLRKRHAIAGAGQLVGVGSRRGPAARCEWLALIAAGTHCSRPTQRAGNRLAERRLAGGDRLFPSRLGRTRWGSNSRESNIRAGRPREGSGWLG